MNSFSQVDGRNFKSSSYTKLSSAVGMQWFFKSKGKKRLDNKSFEFLLVDMKALIRNSHFDDFLSKKLGARAQSTRVYIKVLQTNSPEYFLSFRPKFRQIPGFKKQYIMTVNPFIFTSNLSQKSRVAILTHEIMHLMDYLTSKKRQLVAGLSQLRGKRMLAMYERQTDLNVIKIGSKELSDGLSDYRTWIYGVLPSIDKINKKKRIYLTPKEISLASCIQTEDESLVNRWTRWSFRKQTPLNLVEMNQRSLGHCI